MNEPLGDFGGVVTRKLTLFQKDREIGDKITPEELGSITLRHRRALREAGLVRYYSEPEGVAEGLVTSLTLTRVEAVTSPAPNKRKPKSSPKKRSKSKAKARR